MSEGAMAVAHPLLPFWAPNVSTPHVPPVSSLPRLVLPRDILASATFRATTPTLFSPRSSNKGYRITIPFSSPSSLTPRGVCGRRRYVSGSGFRKAFRFKLLPRRTDQRQNTALEQSTRSDCGGGVTCSICAHEPGLSHGPIKRESET